MNETESKGIVYILTNPSMPDWIKIGYTDKETVDDRLKELNGSTAVPLSFWPYALYHVNDPHGVEGCIHEIIDSVDYSLRSREETPGKMKPREREFFAMSAQRAYKVFQSIARLRGDEDNLELLEPTAEEEAEEAIAGSRRPNIKFRNIEIPVGSELRYLYDPSKVFITADDDNKVFYEGEPISMTKLAGILRGRPGTAIQGTKYFVYEGETLVERRDRLEREE